MANHKDFEKKGDRERRDDLGKKSAERSERSTTHRGKQMEKSDRSEKKHGAPQSERFEQSTFEWSDIEEDEE